MAAVSVVFPWSTCPMVPTFTCGFVLSNFSLLMWLSPPVSVPAHPSDNLVGDRLGDLSVVAELHGVGRTPLGPRAQVGGIAKHGGQRHLRVDDLDAARAWGHSQNFTAPGVEVANDVP